MGATLVAIGGPLRGAAFSLPEGEISVGRDPSNGLALADATVSQRHCVLSCHGRRVVISDLDRGNPTFVNGLPAGKRALEDGDRIRIGTSMFTLTFAEAVAEPGVHVVEEPVRHGRLVALSREEALVGVAGADQSSATRLARELDGLRRINAAINSVRGLVALERPLIELIADIVPASRGALIVSPEAGPEIASAVGWDRETGESRSFDVSRQVIERVLREAVGIRTEAPPPSDAAGEAADRTVTSVLAAPLVAFDEVLGAIYLESDSRDAPFDEGHLRLLMSIAAAAATALGYERRAEALADENRELHLELDGDRHLVGESTAMRSLYQRIGRIAPTESTILITGESGTGKELVARAIHDNSPRDARPFVAINCAAITETLLESELFGHEKGAFTGAIAQKKGKLEIADGGTVFLDEVGELSPALQAKLLRVLQEREFERVGGTRNVAVNFRLVAATNRNLEEAIAAGEFRKDLYYRLNVVRLPMPALRDRAEDIPLLANYFTRRHAARVKRRVTGLSPEAIACLMAYDWPGNVRELENAIERAIVLGSTELILPEDLPDGLVEATPAGSASSAAEPSANLRYHDVINQTKKDLIIKACERSAGNYSAAARALGLHPNYLHRLIRNLDLRRALTKHS